MSRSVIMGELSHMLSQAKLGRYHSMMSCAVRPEIYSELIVHLCVFQMEVRSRYPNANEAYWAIDIFDHHSPELRRARMRKLLNGGLSEYWAFDIVEKSLTTYRDSSGRIIQTKYDQRAKVPLNRFPDIEIDLRELFSQVASQKYGRGVAKGLGLPERLLAERAKDLDHDHPTGQE